MLDRLSASEWAGAVLSLVLIGLPVWIVSELGLYYLFDWIAGKELTVDDASGDWDAAFMAASAFLGMLIGLVAGRLAFGARTRDD